MFNLFHKSQSLLLHHPTLKTSQEVPVKASGIQP
jgi:hypothetical protein